MESELAASRNLNQLGFSEIGIEDTEIGNSPTASQHIGQAKL